VFSTIAAGALPLDGQPEAILVGGGGAAIRAFSAIPAVECAEIPSSNGRPVAGLPFAGKAGRRTFPRWTAGGGDFRGRRDPARRARRARRGL